MARSRKGTRSDPRRGAGPSRPRKDERTAFDRFAETNSRVASHASFFAFALGAVVLWAVWGPFVGFSNQWQLVINSFTTIVTFLMVALLQNSTRRAEKALHHKLDAIADALADFMSKSGKRLERDVAELEDAVGLEEREGS